MGFQIRLSQQRLGIRSGGPRLETICGSQQTRVDSGGFVSTGVSTKSKDPSKTEEKGIGAGEGNRTLVSVGTAKIIENGRKMRDLSATRGPSV